MRAVAVKSLFIRRASEYNRRVEVAPGVSTEPERRKLFVSRAAGITAVYAAIGTGWILVSDWVADTIFGDQSAFATVQTVKGLVYVALTALGLFVLIRRAFQSLHRLDEARRSETEAKRRFGVYLETVIDATPLAVFDLEPDGRVKSIWNHAAERLFGVSRAEAIGSTPDIWPGDVTSFLPDLFSGRSAATEKPAQIEMRRRDGKVFPAEVSFGWITPGEFGDLRAGGETGRRRSVLVAIVSDTTDQVEGTKKLRAAVAEREVLLREIHHRVKNNLQIVASLISLERGRNGQTPETGKGGDGTLSRIMTMARIHEQLYHSHDLRRIDLGPYLTDLCRAIQAAHDPERRVTLRFELSSHAVPIDDAAPYGLITHELVTNALTHAFPERAGIKDPTIVVNLDRSVDLTTLTVSDNGVGFTEDCAPDAKRSLGFTLIDALARQIGADVARTSDQGVSVKVARQHSGQDAHR